MSTTCPISISTSGQFLLNKSNELGIDHIYKANNIQPFFKIDKSNGNCNNIIINFDYISKNQEFTFSIFHTGNISFDGVLKDGKIFNFNEALKFSKFTQYNNKMFIYQCYYLIIISIITFISLFEIIKYSGKATNYLKYIEKLEIELYDLKQQNDWSNEETPKR